MEKSRIVVVDDQPLIRQGMKVIISAQPDMEVVGEGSNGLEAVERAATLEPHLILMDVQMPKCSGIEAAREILRKQPACRIVILTTFDTEEYILEGIRAGAIGYLLKDTEPEELLAAIRASLRGEVIFRTAHAARLIGQAIEKQNLPLPTDLVGRTNAKQMFTNRELEVLQQMAYGLRNEEIAAKLFLSESTVKTHVHRILQKFDVQDRTQAVVYAIRNRIVE